MATVSQQLSQQFAGPIASLSGTKGANERTLFGHPVGLYFLFFTEMWERFSYYGMRVLLVLYMTRYLFVHAESGSYVWGYATLKALLEWMHGPLAIQPLSSHIYGLYTGFVYMTPVLGGILADRWLGPKKTVYLGATIMAVGHFLMASEPLFIVALMLLIVGNGCFKPNISTQLGNLYAADDPRRDRAFTIFYMGVNLGATLSPLICGTLGEVYGWHYGFGAAGVGMIISLIVYWSGQRFLRPELPVARANVNKTTTAREPLTAQQWKAVWGILAVSALSIVFWSVYEQQGNTMQLFASTNTDWNVGPFTIPSTWFQSINPIFIFTLTPLLNIFWSYQALKGKHPSSVVKMAVGCVLLGLSFVVLIWGTQGLQGAGKISCLWLVASTFVLTVGELYLSPVGLSLVSKAAPPRLVGMLTGVWYLAAFFGNNLSGYLGAFYESMPRSTFFMMLMTLGLISGIAIFAVQKPLKNAIGKGL